MSNDQPKMEIAGFLLKRNGQTDFVLVMFFVILVLNVTSLQHKSFTTDEPFHFEYGLKILLTDSDRFDDSKMPVSALNALVVLGELDADDPNMNLDTGKIQRDRLVTVFCSLVLALLIYCWARKLYGLYGAILSLTTYAFAPNILAHSRLNTTDLYAALSLTLVLSLFGVSGRKKTSNGAAPARYHWVLRRSLNTVPCSFSLSSEQSSSSRIGKPSTTRMPKKIGRQPGKWWCDLRPGLAFLSGLRFICQTT